MPFTPAALLILTACGLTMTMTSALGQSRVEDTGLPTAVIDLIGRRTSCDGWIAKIHTDPALSAGLASTLASLRCSDIPQEESALRELYRSNAHIVAELDAKWVKAVQRIPIPPIPNALTPEHQK